jgi:hypothetical protein
MNKERGIYVHLGLLVAAVLAAVLVWTRDKQPKALSPDSVVVWSGRPADVTRIALEAKGKKVNLEAKKDDLGAYYVGSMEKETAPPPVRDAGAPDATVASSDPPASPTRTTIEFVSVGAATKLAESFAPLRAIRALGKIGADRDAEFGLNEPEGTVTVQVRDTERKLLLGAATQGGGDRYVRDPATTEVYVIEGDILRDLETADSKLVERELHEWKDVDIASAELSVGDRKRNIVRAGPEGKQFWADPASPDAKDETITNWVVKLDRLRPTQFVLKAPEGVQPVLRLDYTGRSGKLGFLEMVKVPPAPPATPDAPPAKADYLIRSERTRQFAKVISSSAEQVEQDVSSLLK